jgi:hypothetical protein
MEKQYLAIVPSLCKIFVNLIIFHFRLSELAGDLKQITELIILNSQKNYWLERRVESTVSDK